MAFLAEPTPVALTDNNGNYLASLAVSPSGAAQPVNVSDGSGNAISSSGGALNVNPVPVTSGGCSTAVSQALTTSVNVKPSAGQLYGYAISNPNASVAYVEYYNTATVPGTIGSTTNLLLEVMVPAGATANVSFPNGIAFSAGIAVAVATTATGNTAPGTGLTITTIYK